MWGGRPFMAPGRRGGHGRGGLDAYLLLLFAQLVQRVAQLEHKPPVTLALMAANAAVFFRDLMPPPLRDLIPPLSRACLQPRAVLQGGQWSRLFWSAWMHADEYHLYYNLSSLLWKGARLEARLGPARFAALTAELLALSHGLVAAASYLLAEAVPEYRRARARAPPMYLSTCMVGFSAVLFAYKVVLNHDDPTHSSILGWSLPTKYACWAELLLASAFNPQASFFGHLCGIAAGFIHVWAAARLRRGGGRRALARAAAAAGALLGAPRRPRFTGGGAAGGGAAARPAAAAPQARPEAAAARPMAAPAPLPAAAAGRSAAAARGGVQEGRVTGGAAALTEDELRRRRIARFGGT
ncbi:MAG: hypothetical protein J3K34DRAFT_461543 [Monoraphidium minutum]|nr:MAG: hypothetical protein J3K34DRAFT_461543 [Monoraphidium minutum]